jgi:cytoskeletal protein CcmA (bactofilin family)
MDENTDLTQGASPDFDESNSNPEPNAKDSSGFFTNLSAESTVLATSVAEVAAVTGTTDATAVADATDAAGAENVTDTVDVAPESTASEPLPVAESYTTEIEAASPVSVDTASPEAQSPADSSAFDMVPEHIPATAFINPPADADEPLAEADAPPVDADEPLVEAGAPATDADEEALPPSLVSSEAPVEVVKSVSTNLPLENTAAPQQGSPVAEAIESEAAASVEKLAEDQLAVATAAATSNHLTSEAIPADPAAGEPIEAEEESEAKGISVITREATVLGDIITEGHIDIVGRVKGNIDAKGDVAIHGVVRGDVDGSKIGLYSCRVKGNLDAGLGVIVDDDSIIGGDVKTKNIIFDGKVKGNIEAENVVVLRSHSYCLGDVSAASLAVEPGAILNGKVRTFVDGDLEAPFDEVM